MFTGIIESLGHIKNLEKEESNLRITVSCDFIDELKIDQSIAHNGVCLTVEKLGTEEYEVIAVKETLNKTNLADLSINQKINLERCMQMNGRLDGHIVQGHVDEIAQLTNIKQEQGSWVFSFMLAKDSKLVVEKGSICINGTSLTAFNVNSNCFDVTIIPYTFEHTVFHQLKIGDSVNIEFDIVGKYIQKMLPPS